MESFSWHIYIPLWRSVVGTAVTPELLQFFGQSKNRHFFGIVLFSRTDKFRTVVTLKNINKFVEKFQITKSYNEQL